MKPLIYHAEAWEEHREAIRFYSAGDAEGGRAFKKLMRETRTRLQGNPKSFAEDDETGTREVLVSGFPYSFHYLELDTYIWVVAVAHHRRRPYYWRSRLLDL